jgi:tetratricopeptide (TPR) repeat protein
MAVEMPRVFRAGVALAYTLLLSFSLSSCSTPALRSMKHEVKPMTRELNIDTLWNFGNPAESEQRFRDAITTANENEKLELETQIARTYGLRRDYARAYATLDAVQQRITSDTPEIVLVRLALERGRAIRSERDFEAARPYFQEAFDRAQAAKLTLLAIDAAHMFGFSKNLDEAMQWNERAMMIARSIDVPRAIEWRATLANNMGVSERGREYYDKALAHFREALAAETQLKRAKRVFVANWQIANTLRLQGKIDEALAIQANLEVEMVAKNEPDAYVYDELAELHFAKQDLAKAKRYAQNSLTLIEKDNWVQKNEAVRVERLRALAQ